MAQLPRRAAKNDSRAGLHTSHTPLTVLLRLSAFACARSLAAFNTFNHRLVGLPDAVVSAGFEQQLHKLSLRLVDPMLGPDYGVRI